MSYSRKCKTVRKTKELVCKFQDCGKPFQYNGWSRKEYCSKRCRSSAYKKKMGHSCYKDLGISSGTAGAIGELRVCCDLLAKGYEVFRSVSPACSCDLVVRKDGKMFRVEVRTGIENPITGYASYTLRHTNESRFDALAVVYRNRIEYRPELT